MAPFVLNLLAAGGSFALYVWLAVRSRTGSLPGFYVAGRRVPPIINGMATAADWISAASFLSMAGLIAWSGYGASGYLMGWTGGYVLLALLLAPYLRKSGALTVAGFLGRRFSSPAARSVAVVALIAASGTYLVGQMTGLGIAFARLLEVDLTSGLMIGAALVFLCVVPGGMRSVTRTQVAQYAVMVAAYTLPAVFLSLLVTGSPLPPLGLFGDLAGSPTPLLQRLDALVTDLGFAAYTGQDGTPAEVIDMVLFTLTLMIGTAGLPHVLMRFLTVPRVRDARWSAGWALLFIAVVYLSAPALGAMLRLSVVDTLYPEGPRGAALAYADRPDWMRTWEATGMLTWQDLNGDGRIQSYAGDSAGFMAEAAARGWAGDELTLNRDILILANPEIAGMPDWVAALVAAGGIAAALSTATGLVLAIASAISHDLIRARIAPGISVEGELLAARLVMGVVIFASTAVGFYPAAAAVQTVSLAFGIAAATLFPALMMGIFTKRINSSGAVAGMASGLAFTLCYIFLHRGWFLIPGTNLFPDTTGGSLLGISSTAIGAVGAMVNFAVAYFVSMATGRPPQEIEELVEAIRIPGGAGPAAGSR